LRIRKYFFQIQIREAVILTYGSGSRTPITYGSDRIQILRGHKICRQIGTPVVYR